LRSGNEGINFGTDFSKERRGRVDEKKQPEDRRRGVNQNSDCAANFEARVIFYAEPFVCCEGEAGLNEC